MDKTAADLDKEIQDHLLITAWKKTKQPRSQIEYGSPLYWALSREDRRKKEAATARRKAKPTNITALNLSTLGETVVNYGGHAKFPNQINTTDRNGIKRCMDGGYVKIVGADLALTPAGRAAVGDWIVAELENEAKHPVRADDTYYQERQQLRVHKLEHAAQTLGNERAHARVRRP
jgi:hypothetical protein